MRLISNHLPNDEPSLFPKVQGRRNVDHSMYSIYSSVDLTWISCRPHIGLTGDRVQGKTPGEEGNGSIGHRAHLIEA